MQSMIIRKLARPGVILVAALLIGLALLVGQVWSKPDNAQAAGILTVTSDNAAYLVFDHNKPATETPGTFYAEGQVCNTGDADLTNVVAYIGDGTTAGTFPVNPATSQSLQLTDTKIRPGDVSDGTRSLGTLAPGQCVFVYWSVSYPVAAGLDNTTLDFTIWATADGGASGSVTETVTLRDDISASANKINAVSQTITPSPLYQVGEQLVICFTNIDFGVVGAGSDPDGAGPLPSVNDFYFQPTGGTQLDPDSLRLVKTTASFYSTKCDNDPYNYVDHTYFDQINSGDWDDNGSIEACAANSQQVTGSYCYYFVALEGGVVNSLNPYQQASSGTQQKYNGDYNTTTVPVEVEDACSVELVKTGSPDDILSGGTLTYNIVFTNLLTTTLGYYPGSTLVITDTIPISTTYNAGSATCGTYTCTILYSTDNGVSWSGVEPVPASSVTDLKFVMNASIAGEASDTVTYTVTVNTNEGVIADPATSNFGGGAFCSASGIVTTTPVTLSYFKASLSNGRLILDWTTSRETGNAGFNFYVQTAAGLQRLNTQLVASQAVSSQSPQDYHLELDGVSGSKIYIEDVDLFGRTRKHGPFEFDQVYGQRAELVAVDWAAVLSGKSELARQRQAERKVAANNLLDRARTQAANTAEASAQALAAGPVVNLLVNKDGLYRVTYQDLLAAGYNFNGVSASAIALTNRGIPQAITVISTRSGAFSTSSYIEFYGQALDTLYTKTNVYTLHLDSSKALRAATDNTRPNTKLSPASYYMETARVEKDLKYEPASPTGDPWFEASMLVYTSPKAWNYSISVNNYLSGVAPASLSVGYFGYTDFGKAPDHRVVVGLNGTDLSNNLFDGVSSQQVNVQLPAGLLVDGANTLNIKLPADTGVAYDMIGLDQYSISYPRRFQAQAGALKFDGSSSLYQVNGLPNSSVVVYRLNGSGLARMTAVAVSSTNGAYSAKFAGTSSPSTFMVSAVSALLKPGFEAVPPSADIQSGSAQYLVISHPDFIAGLAPLTAQRSADGLAVKVVNVEDIYAQYSGGVFDPQAIQDYIRFAANNLGTQYVLLVGGDTYDYKNNLNLGSLSFIPSLYAATDRLIQFAPVDSLFADINGDSLQDLAIGRFPVRTSVELDYMVTKTLQYGSQPATSIFASDFSFSADSDIMASQLIGWSKQFASMDDSGAATARAQLIAAINGGAKLTNFAGHSSDWEWTFDGLFSIYDAQALTNIGSPTVVNQYACWSNYYVNPKYDGLASEFLVNGYNGAAAVLGVTGMSDAGHARQFGVIFTEKMGQTGMPIGQAIVDAKQHLAQNRPGYQDILLGWTLLGDPYLQVSPYVAPVAP